MDCQKSCLEKQRELLAITRVVRATMASRTKSDGIFRLVGSAISQSLNVVNLKVWLPITIKEWGFLPTPLALTSCPMEHKCNDIAVAVKYRYRRLSLLGASPSDLRKYRLRPNARDLLLRLGNSAFKLLCGLRDVLDGPLGWHRIKKEHDPYDSTLSIARDEAVAVVAVLPEALNLSIISPPKGLPDK
ncbi:hypothetical protein OEB96_42420 [Paraliomyxa miuraensis]|nr:hypothetical protein [Paraliomyxa miuraensis]MCX4247346.1 hypothetical protein [Paraliomyxa miuraensis]